jgi:hypothetical protein
MRASTVYSGKPAFRRPSVKSFAFVDPPQAVHAGIVVKAGSTWVDHKHTSRPPHALPHRHLQSVLDRDEPSRDHRALPRDQPLRRQLAAETSALLSISTAVVTLPTRIVVTDGPSAHDRLAVLTQENLWRDIAGALLDSAVTNAAYRTGKEYSKVAGRHAGTICEPIWAFGECLKNAQSAQPTTH